MSLEELIGRAGTRLEQHAPIGPRTTYRVGGSVRALVTLTSNDDLDELGPLLLRCGLPFTVIGNGSNLLVADGELALVAVLLAGEFANLSWSGSPVVMVDAGAGLDLPVAARRLAAEGITGFEWAVGVPGTFGGATAMNAGGHGSDMAACVHSATVWRNGERQRLSLDDLHFAYRSSAVRAGDIVTTVTLRLSEGDAEESKRTIGEIVRWRRTHQPGGANGGSVFRNPPGESAGRLIERTGCKGLRIGSAVVSEKHANFILVDAGGRAADVYELLSEVRRRVREATGVTLESEHRLLGFGEPG